MDLLQEAKTVNVEPYNEKYLDWMWGRAAKFPESFMPTLVVTNIISPLYGILLCNVAKDRFMIAFNHVTKTVHKDVAMALIDRCEPDGRGGARENSGRKPAPEGAKRRSVTVTEEEYSHIQEWLKEYRNG